MSYEKLSIEEFGAHLLESGDLDPLYITLVNAEIPEAGKKGRFLVAYWCLYHVGCASWCADAETPVEFWQRLMEATANITTSPVGGRFPRGHERRHFRGQQGINAVNSLADRYQRPETMVSYVADLPNPDLSPQPFREVADRAMEHRGFGPWMAFKIADMVDRLGIRPVSFDNAAVFMFKDPQKAAAMVYERYADLPKGAVTSMSEFALQQVVDHLSNVFERYRAPPLGDRPVALQEVETILCKWKSHMNGHYPLNNDIREIRHGLEDWSRVSATAGLLLKHMPKEL